MKNRPDMVVDGLMHRKLEDFVFIEIGCYHSNSSQKNVLLLTALVQYNKRNIFLRKSCRRSRRETSARPICCFLRKLYLRSLNLAYNLSKILGYWSRDMLDFHFLEKGVGIVSPLHFVYDFSKKKCYSCYILLADQI